jgi:aminopeptidase N
MGFRRITFWPDRPDVLSMWSVRLEGDAATLPVLLSNGNMVQAGQLPGGRHYTLWEVCGMCQDRVQLHRCIIVLPVSSVVF